MKNEFSSERRGNRPSADIVDDLLDFVDSEDCPNSWPRGVDCEALLDEASCPSVVEQLVPFHNGKIPEIITGITDPASRYCLRDTTHNEFGNYLATEIEDAWIENQVRREVLPVSIGLALGLRMAGVSKEAARTILRGFLRNYITDEAPNSNDKKEF